VQGLVQLATSPNVNIPQLTQIFTGTMIGTLSLVSGAVSAGAGAAIVGAVGAIIDILQTAGLFGSSPPGVDICQGMKCNPVPDWVIGCENRACPCLCVWNQNGSSGIIAPGSRDWRSFPNSNDPNDADWFRDATLGGDFSFVWKGLKFGRTLTVNPAGDDRPIDEAFGPGFFVDFPAYQAVEQFTAPAAIAQNQQIAALSPPPLGFTVQQGGPLSLAFCAAWKANAEYSLNGLKAQPAWVVLLHTIRLWNRSHAGPVFAWNATSGPGEWSPVLSDLSKNVPTTDPLWLADGSIAINEGALISPQVLTPDQLAAVRAAAEMAVQAVAGAFGQTVGPAPSTPTTTTTPATSSAGTAAAVTVVAAAATGGLWLLLGQPMTLAALKGAIEEGVHAASGALRRL